MGSNHKNVIYEPLPYFKGPILLGFSLKPVIEYVVIVWDYSCAHGSATSL